VTLRRGREEHTSLLLLLLLLSEPRKVESKKKRENAFDPVPAASGTPCGKGLRNIMLPLISQGEGQNMPPLLPLLNMVI